MRKLTILLLLLIVQSGIALNTIAQSDSTTFADAAWTTTQVKDGLKLRSHHFRGNLFNSNQFISILEIDPTLIKLDVVADTVLTKTSDLSEENNALAAVNGSFFDLHSKGLPYNSVVYMKIDGKTLSNNKQKSDKRGFHQQGALVILYDKVFILESDNTSDWESYIYGEDILTSGPLLKIDGKLKSLAKNAFNSNRHPRTIVATVSPNLVYLIVIDGRSSKAAGMSLPEVQQIINWLGAKNALNMDGGGSSAMVLQGATTSNSVVSHPSDNNQFDNKGQRKVANAIICSEIPQYYKSIIKQ